ncbi:hypothetical protein [Pectobacterium carotovorum]|uniref:hypothetical protein n=1 Tax=Pectobacterium carotovorum TaxID=554 RepID=UPI0037F24A1E
MMKINSIGYDDVIKSYVLNAEADYSFAIEKLFPLIDRFDSQRKLQNKKFYDRLRIDLIRGCLMPALTLAFVEKEKTFQGEDIKEFTEYVNKEITNGYILDGMQRLNTLYSIKDHEGIDLEQKIYLSIIISNKKDMLLYRMITLNNGQKPMSPRHQIEVLTEELMSFETENIKIQTEKEKANNIIRGSYDMADIAKSYLAFFTGSVNNENNKIISEKMDEIILGRIMSHEIIDKEIQFEDVIRYMDKMSWDLDNKKWFGVSNNMIGFSVGYSESYDYLNSLSVEEFKSHINSFDKAFSSINPSKVNLGKFRRTLSQKYFSKVNELKDDYEKILNFFIEETES